MFWHNFALVAAPSSLVAIGCAIETSLHFHYSNKEMRAAEATEESTRSATENGKGE